MEKTNEKISRYYTTDRPEFIIEIVKKGPGRGCEYEAWLGKDDIGVMDFMFGLIPGSEQEFLDIVEDNLPRYIGIFEDNHP